MSIVTKTGDSGSTGLMYNRRVPKSHDRVEAYGCVDELNAALGMARARSAAGALAEKLLIVQKDLVVLMGELATPLEELERYRQDGYHLADPSMVEKLDQWVVEIEAEKPSFKGWATPGASLESASLDLARTVCRRAERRVCKLMEAGELRTGDIPIYLNRLSDLLWLMARWVESQEPALG